MTPRLTIGDVCRVLLALLGSATISPAATVRFNHDIQPILSEHCLTCHGQDEKARKAGLRLDDRDLALKGGKSGKPAIAPGEPAVSELIARITAKNPDDVMPPPDTKKPLTAAEIETLRRWIASGAEYQKHWAFIPPERPALPAPSAARTKSPVDAFVRARLKTEKLRPSPEAAPEVLCRRLHLDLVGLPPSLEDVDQFVAAYKKNREQAYRDLVEQLLASPHYGEKWARGWLDAARYADSDGYEKDLPRQQWTWRDWVISAFNRDLPYDQFIIEQIAGDQLPNATQDQRVATGFLRNGMVNEEGAILAEQFRVEGLIDRMDCLGKAVLGLTVQCAQCHSHKYDPLKQDEYYSLFAFLNNDYEAQSSVYTPAELQTIARIQQGVAEQEEKLRAAHPDWEARFVAWEEQQRQVADIWTDLKPEEVVWMGGLAHPDILPDNSVLSLGFRPTTGELYVTTRTSLTNSTGLRLEALTHGDLPFSGPGRSYKGTFAISELYVEARPAGSTNEWQKIALTNATADFATAERPPEQFFHKQDDKRVIGPASFLVDGKDETAWGPDRGPGRRHADSQAVLQFATNGWAGANGTELKIWFKYRHGGEDAHGRQNNYLGRFRLALTTADDPKATPLSVAACAALKLPKERRMPEQQQQLFTAWRESVGEFQEFNDAIARLWAEYPEGASVLNLGARAPEFRRTTHLLERGNWQKPGKEVAPGVPAFLNPLPANAPLNRLTLAHWLVDRGAPTTARVLVNRTWAALWGNGLVETPDDFGNRAPLPTHPELLDWLAVELMEPTALPGEPAVEPWSLKHLLRVMVTSTTYRQSSRVSPELLARDPRNQLLARGPRFRADAEVVRDIALSASGLLTDKTGGPSVFPPMPDGIFALSYLKVDFWNTATGPDRYRRSLYTFRRRSMPDPLLQSFDAPNGDVACVRRNRSNTPLAALASLNEPVFVEASQALALRTLRDGGDSDAGRAAFAFRLCTGRAPRSIEIADMLSLLKFSQHRAADGWIAPREIAFADAAKAPELPANVTPTQTAAWSVVARVLLNLDETITKN
jgi:mono/diheme cytochrome c family protein